MELKTPTTIITTTAAAAAAAPGTTTTTPETETETTPKHLANSKGLSFTNGAFKLLHSYPPPPQPVIVYKECLKNHAAALGGHALDGCGEFMPSPTATATDPTSLKCAACGCHRNFHRRDPEETLTHMIEYHPHLPAPITPHRVRSPNSSVSPPPISSSYYPSAPQMLLALSTGGLSVKPENHYNTNTVISPMGGSNSGRKRFRTKFSQEQKDKMFSFSEKLGWKMQKKDEMLVEEFCNEVGVGKSVLKVWMHNNKHTFAKREVNGNGNDNGNGNGNGNGISGNDGGGGANGGANFLQHNTVMSNPDNSTTSNNINNSSSMMNHLNHGNSAHVGTNCSSSSS